VNHLQEEIEGLQEEVDDMILGFEASLGIVKRSVLDQFSIDAGMLSAFFFYRDRGFISNSAPRQALTLHQHQHLANPRNQHIQFSPSVQAPPHHLLKERQS